VIALEHFAKGTDTEWQSYPLTFCPLPRKFRREKTLRPLYKRFERAYDRYLRQYVKRFYREMTRADVQIVLVDVLRILRRGVQSYNDIQLLTDTILEHFTFPKLAEKISWRDPGAKLRSYWKALSEKRQIRRTIFSATKADLVRADDRPVMARLVGQMVYKWLRRFELTAADDFAQVGYCSANRATEDGYSAKSNQQVLKALVRETGAVRECVFVPPALPERWPDEPWDVAEFSSPWAVLPRKLPARDGAVINHIGLDRILAGAIRDFLPGGH
jgi:predicted YcjX-like family ATPase